MWKTITPLRRVALETVKAMYGDEPVQLKLREHTGQRAYDLLAKGPNATKGKVVFCILWNDLMAKEYEQMSL